MKKYLKITLLVVVAAIFIGTFIFLYQKSKPKTTVYETVTPEIADLEKTTVATGKVEPRDEVLIKPQISGIISEVYKEAGQTIKQGEVIAKVKVIPELGQLNSAESRVRVAEISTAQAETDHERIKKLYNDKLISREDYEKSEVEIKKAREELQTAKDALEIIKEGITKNSASFSSTLIRSTIDGLILDVPIKVGNSVIMSNTFNDGTTIATVANMNDLIFKGIVYGKDNGLGLINMRGLDYDDEKWDELLDQLTPSDYQTLITQSGYGTAAIKSVDKPSTTDRDAATGLVNYGVDASGNFYFKGNITHCGVIVLAQTYNDDLAYHYGENIGDESYYLHIDGWYAPAVNMHRTAFSGRNSEYYSEDPFVSGHIASLECKGVASRGMYVFVKHFAVNDQENHRGDREGQFSIATFLNEQAAREIYLKPFEMCIKTDDVQMNYAKDNGDGTYSNATREIPSVTGVMTSFNRIGYTWAGGNYNMITGLLRNEWGFHGFIITDNANTGVFMDAGQMIQAGADGKLTNLPTGARYTFNKNDVSDYHYGREAVHNILYTIANSKAMNGGMPGSRYLAKVEPYQKVIYAVDGVCGGLIAVLVILTIFRFRKKKEDNIKTV